jgi:hypothetical protein
MAAFLMETREGTHILMLYIYFTDFNAKRIKSKINKYKINNQITRSMSSGLTTLAKKRET